MCESRGGRPGLPVPNRPYGFCGRKAILEEEEEETKKKKEKKRRRRRRDFRAQELCESRGGRP